MTRTLLLCTVLLAGCDALFGSVEDRQPCAGSAGCPVGQFCASTGSARVCWEDAVAPAVGGVTVSCSTSPCLRDALLTVEAQASDDQELGAVTVALDLDGGARQVAMARVGGVLHRATLDLSEWPLAGVSATVTATVSASDGARTVRAATAAAGQRPVVTRVREAVDLGVVPTAPALLQDGTVVVGGADGHLHSVAPGGGVAQVSARSFGLAVTQPPTVGRSAVWVASANNRLYAVTPDGGTVLNGAGYDTGGTIAGPAALTAAAPTAGAPEVAFVGSAGGRMAAVKAEAAVNGVINFTGIIAPFTTSPLLVDDATLYGVTGIASPASASLRRFSYDGGIREGVSTEVGRLVTAPLAAGVLGVATANASIWTASSEFEPSTLRETNPDGTPGTSIPLGASAGGGAIILSNGDVALCVGNQLHRFTAAGAPAWAAPATLDGAGLTPLVLASPAGPPTLLVPTRAGTVHAVHAQTGAPLWSLSLSVNELREGTVRAAAGARTSTAWFTSADGLLHGLVVDGALDAAAPWPKAWHDARNTGNLGAAH
jgi:outer membrane protein assembly factor BamB